MRHEKNPLTFHYTILYCLVNMDPYIGLLQSQYNWVAFPGPIFSPAHITVFHQDAKRCGSSRGSKYPQEWFSSFLRNRPRSSQQIHKLRKFEHKKRWPPLKLRGQQPPLKTRPIAPRRKPDHSRNHQFSGAMADVNRWRICPSTFWSNESLLVQVSESPRATMGISSFCNASILSASLSNTALSSEGQKEPCFF